MSERRACHGASVLECGDMAECIACERELRWDMQDHPFWGWHSCPDAPTGDGSQQHHSDAVDPAAPRTVNGPTRDPESDSSSSPIQTTAKEQA